MPHVGRQIVQPPHPVFVAQSLLEPFNAAKLRESNTPCIGGIHSTLDNIFARFAINVEVQLIIELGVDGLRLEH